MPALIYKALVELLPGNLVSLANNLSNPMIDDVIIGAFIIGLLVGVLIGLRGLGLVLLALLGIYNREHIYNYAIHRMENK